MKGVLKPLTSFATTYPAHCEDDEEGEKVEEGDLSGIAAWSSLSPFSAGSSLTLIAAPKGVLWTLRVLALSVAAVLIVCC